MRASDSPIILLASGLDVAPLRDALAAQPHLWNRRTGRTAHPESPHHGLDDIWVRWVPDGENSAVQQDTRWNVDSDALPVRRIAYGLMGMFQGDSLGGVLITRIPPRATCRPHVDGGWHATTHQKFAVQIDAAPGQKFCFEDAELETQPGDLYWFDNSKLHWVVNPTDKARLTLIVCIKTDWRPSCLSALQPQ